MKIGDLRRKARRGSLEVEDLLAAAKARLPDLAVELRSLSAQCNWSSVSSLPDGTRVVPLARWAETVAAYSEGGIQALAALASDKESVPCVIGVLEELSSSDSLDVLLSICSEVKAPQAELHLAWRLAEAINLMMSFATKAPASEEQCKAAVAFLHMIYPLATDEAKRATVLLALRGVGGTESLALARSAADFYPPWQDVKARVATAITRRVGAKVASPG
jgi:hypothetical protein